MMKEKQVNISQSKYLIFVMLLLIVGCSRISTNINDVNCMSNDYLSDEAGDKIAIVVMPLPKDEKSLIKLNYCGSNINPSRSFENLILDVDNRNISIEYHSIEGKNISEDYFLTPTTFSRDHKLKSLNITMNYMITYDQIDSVVKADMVKVRRFGGLNEISILLDKQSKDEFKDALNMHNSARYSLFKELKLGVIDLTETFRIVFDKKMGVYIEDVFKGGLGEEIGLESNTVILSVNNTNITSVEHLKTTIRDMQPEDLSITVRYYDGKEKTLAKSYATWEDDPLKVLGITLTELTANYKDVFVTSHGIFIDNLEEGYGSRQGLEVATVILQLDETKINSVDQFKNLLKEKIGKTVTIIVKERNGIFSEVQISLSN